MFVFARLAQGAKAQWLFNADVAHSFTYIPDAAQALALLGGLFDRTAKEVVEMAYQNELPYSFDSTKFNTAFGYEPVSYKEGIAATVKAMGLAA
jgi:nucleoside-diphosphate-sugar epimerase